jgi:hypothetical protein
MLDGEGDKGDDEEADTYTNVSGADKDEDDEDEYRYEEAEAEEAEAEDNTETEDSAEELVVPDSEEERIKQREAIRRRKASEKARQKALVRLSVGVSEHVRAKTYLNLLQDPKGVETSRVINSASAKEMAVPSFTAHVIRDDGLEMVSQIHRRVCGTYMRLENSRKTPLLLHLLGRLRQRVALALKSSRRYRHIRLLSHRPGRSSRTHLPSPTRAAMLRRYRRRRRDQSREDRTLRWCIP